MAGNGMRRNIGFWTLSIAILAAGAWVVCPGGLCGLTDFDRIGLEAANGLRSPQLDRFMRALTWLGSLRVLLPMTGLGAWLLYRRGRRGDAGFLVLAVSSSAALGHVVKLWVARPRPDLFPPAIPLPEDWSYPSNHAMQAAAAALALWLLAGRSRAALALLFGGVVLAVGFSRIYLQVHYPSDVVAGTLAAGFWVAGLHALMFRNTGVRNGPNGGFHSV